MTSTHVSLIEESFQEFSRQWAAFPSATRWCIEGFEIIHTGFSSGLNRVLCVGGEAVWMLDEAMRARRLGHLRDELRKRPGSYVLFLRSDDPVQGLALALKSFRFFRDPRLDWACMTRGVSLDYAIKGEASGTSGSDSLVVATVEDPDDILVWAEVVCDGFELNPAAKRTMFAQLVLRYLNGPKDGMLLMASHQGVPAGALAVHDTKEASGLFWVATVPKKRRLGVGRALIQGAIRHAAEVGKKTVVLQATSAGKPLYASMGFEEAYSYQLHLHKS